MFNKKIVLFTSIFVICLIVTSFIKNKTRMIEKKIYNLNVKILSNKKKINQAQLDFHYITSPAEIEKRLSTLGLDTYQPIKHSKIFFNISDLNKLQKKISNIDNLNEKKN